jgi:predicted hotdog family 3-hydroxylacyl-ACP dehydratase
MADTQKKDTFAADIEQLLPHRGRMKLIGAIERISTDNAVTRSVVSETWPLCSGNSVSPIVLIELAAQTAGVLSCWKKGENISAFAAGMLTGIKCADFFVDTVPVNAELTSTATIMYSLDDYEAMEVTVMMGQTCLCKVQLQIFGLRAETGV